MANLGAEVSRIISAKEKGDSVLVAGAQERAEQMLSEIRGLPDMQSRMAEIEMLGEVIRSLTDSVSELHITPQNIKSYFMPFAMRLMTT